MIPLSGTAASHRIGLGVRSELDNYSRDDAGRIFSHGGTEKEKN